jgi:excisionase family DNA binding protein
MSEDRDTRFLTSVEVASACGVSPRTVGNWIRAGSIPAHRTVGGHARISADDLRRFLDDRHIPVPPALARPSAAPPRPSEAAAGRPRVLVIDDDEPLLDVMAEMLGAGGWQVETARHGFLGGYLLGLNRPDAIVLDIMMPGLDGFEALSLLRRRPEASGIPVVACTSLQGPEIEAKLRAAGFDALVRKPIDFAGLLRTLEGFRR